MTIDLGSGSVEARLRDIQSITDAALSLLMITIFWLSCWTG